MSSVTILRMLVQILILPVLARVLSPTDYGVVALAMPFVLFAMALSDAGMSASLIRSKTHNDAEWSTGFWAVTGLGLLLALILTSVGLAGSFFLKEPLLFPVVAVLSLTILLQSIATVPGTKLQQNNQFGTIAKIDVLSMLVSLISAVTSAYCGWGVWALVTQQVTHFATKMIMTLLLSGFRPRMIFHMPLIHHHLIFGRDMLGVNFINFIRQSVNSVMIGKILGTAPVGIYSMATTFSELPLRIISGPVQNVLYPRITALHDNIKTLRTLFLFITRIMSVCIIPGISMVAVAHAPIFQLVLSEKWREAGFVFMWLSPAAIILCITALRGTLAIALGQTTIWLKQSYEITLMSILALICAVPFGIQWVAVAYSFAIMLYIPRSLSKILPLIDVSLSDYFKTMYIPCGLSLGSILLYLATTQVNDIGDWSKFFVAFVLGGATCLISLALQKDIIKQNISDLRHALQNATPPLGNTDA